MWPSKCLSCPPYSMKKENSDRHSAKGPKKVLIAYVSSLMVIHIQKILYFIYFIGIEGLEGQYNQIWAYLWLLHHFIGISEYPNHQK